MAQNVDGFLFQSFTGDTTFNIDRSTTSTFQLDLNAQVPFSSYWHRSIFFRREPTEVDFSRSSRGIRQERHSNLTITTPDGTAFTPPNGLLDPVNNIDLGASCSDLLPMEFRQGSILLADLLSRSVRIFRSGSTLSSWIIAAAVMDDGFNEHPCDSKHGNDKHRGTPPALALMSAASRKIHGSAGTFDIDLPLAGEPGIESRNTGGDHTLVFTFNNTVVSGSASVTSGIGSVAGSPTFSGHTMTVELTSVADVQRITVTLHNVTDGFAQVLPDTAVSVNMLIGDDTFNRAVNASRHQPSQDAKRNASDRGQLSRGYQCQRKRNRFRCFSGQGKFRAHVTLTIDFANQGKLQPVPK